MDENNVFEEIKEEPVVEEAVEAVEEAVEAVEETVSEAAEEVAEEAAEVIEEIEGEPVRNDAFENLKVRFNALKSGDLPEGVAEKIEDLKRLGFEVKEKGVGYAKKLGESGEAYKAKMKARSENMKKQSKLDELLYEIGEVAYDGHKSGEDVSAVLDYLFKKVDQMEAPAQEAAE